MGMFRGKLDYTKINGREHTVLLTSSSVKSLMLEAARCLEGELLNSATLKIGERRWSWDFRNERWSLMKVEELSHDAE